MAKIKRKKLPLLIIVIISFVLIFLLLFVTRKNNLTQEEAILKIKMRSEVIDYLKQVPAAKIEINGEEGDSYLIQVYEIKDNHTATFNWYKVNKTTGEIKKEF